MMDKIGESLRAQREQRGLTQVQVGALVGVSGPAVSYWEAGRTVPPLEALVKLADAWAMPLDALVGRQPRRRKQRAGMARSGTPNSCSVATKSSSERITR